MIGNRQEAIQNCHPPSLWDNAQILNNYLLNWMGILEDIWTMESAYDKSFLLFTFWEMWEWLNMKNKWASQNILFWKCLYPFKYLSLYESSLVVLTPAKYLQTSQRTQITFISVGHWHFICWIIIHFPHRSR